MIVRKLRIQRSWSQEQLSGFSGLSVRTIQRIERGKKASLESLKSLAAVFEIDISELQQESDMTNHQQVSKEEQEAIEYVKDIKDFYSHLISFVITITFLIIINLVLTPGYFWVIWVILGWGIGLASHAFSVFEVFSFFSPDWEKKQIEKRLGRDL